MSRTYAQLAEGRSLHDAPRQAQMEYLTAISNDDPPEDLRQIIEDAGGAEAAALPWYWALTVAGAPPGPVT